MYRYNPAHDPEPHYETYEVPVTYGMSVMNALQYVSANYDGGLAYYASCRYGLCGGCVVKVDGKAVMSCTEPADRDMTVESVSESRVIKDLLVR